jgi:ElaA protein
MFAKCSHFGKRIPRALQQSRLGIRQNEADKPEGSTGNMMMRPPHRYVWRGFRELSAAELYSVLRLRCEVFVVEQQCAYLDVDGRDPEADHLLAWGNNDLLAGCLRVFAPDEADATAQIGRVVTAPEARGTGLGRWLMDEAVDFIAERHGAVRIKISAQAHLERFYTDFGFSRSSADYLEDGILHCEMLRSA